MTITASSTSDARGASRGRRRRWASIAAGVLGSAVLASPASAAVAPGHAITMFHNSDFVAATGYDGVDSMTVEVRRNGVTIGTATGPPQATPEGAGLEVNHGPEGAAQPGDCWDNVTPDVLPGDEIHVTSRGPLGEVIGLDTTVVGDVEFNGDAPREEPAGSGDIVVEGSGAAADELSGEVRVGSAFRAFPTTVENIPAASTSWRATYSVPYDVNRNRDGADPKQAILGGEHSMTHAPNEQEVTIAELGAAGGPGPGCEGSPREANAVVASDDAAVNINSGSLVLSGTARADTDEVEVTVESSEGGSVTAPATLSGGAPQKTWTVTIPRAEIDADLADGTLTASGEYTGPDGTLTGATLQLQKDTVAPGPPTATPGAGTYSSSQSVSLNGEDGTDIRYTVDGSTPTPGSRLYSGQIQVTSSQTIKAIAVDQAGNAGAVATFEYVIQAPPDPPDPPAPPAPPAAPKPSGPSTVGPQIVTVVQPLRVSELSGRKSLGRRAARRRGVRVSFVAPNGAKVVWVQLYKKQGRSKTLVATKKVLVSEPGRKIVRFKARRLRKRLGSGKYVVEVTPGTSSANLGTTSKWSLRIR